MLAPVLAATLAVAFTAVPACAQDAPAAFNVDSIEVVGATVLGSDDIETLVYPFTGEGRTAADMEAARKALQDAYAARGYEAVVVDIVPQDEAYQRANIVQIRVAEAPVGEVRVAGAKHHSVEALRAQLSAAQPGQPLNLKALQTQLVEANRMPDRQVQPSFRPSKTEGAIDVELKVKDSLPFHGSVELGNDNSPNTHPLRLAASARYTNLWGAGHTVSASYIVTPQDRKQTEVVLGSYVAPVLGSPWSIVVSGYRSNSNIAALGGTQVFGNGWQLGARAMYRIAGEHTDQSFSVGLDYKDFKQNTVVKGVIINQAPVRYVPIALGWTMSRFTDNSELEIGLNATFGLRTIKRTFHCVARDSLGQCIDEDQFPNASPSGGSGNAIARENFAHINLDVTASRVIADDVSLIIKLAGQYADSHLVSNEQFGIGGESTVRGYFQSEAVGDRGVAAGLQLDGPSLATYLPAFVGELRPFAFFDSGVVGVIDPLTDQESTFRLAGIGGGIRYRLFKHLSGGLTIGVPLVSRPDTRRGDARVTFSARGEF